MVEKSVEKTGGKQEGSAEHVRKNHAAESNGNEPAGKGAAGKIPRTAGTQAESKGGDKMKRCEICGADISTPDYYAMIRRKYCKECAAERKRQQKAEWQAKWRAAQREKNALTRELCKTQAAEIEALRDLVRKQREQLRSLKGV